MCINGLGHMTKLAAMPLYGKNLKKNFSRTRSPMILKLGMQYRELKFYKVYINNYPELTLTYFTARSNLVTWAFLWEKVKTVNFSETIEACDLKVGRYRQLIEVMKVCEH